MKAEERHRLHENDLQRLTEQARERTRPFFDQYGTTLLFALAGVLVVVAAAAWYYNRSDPANERGWGELDAAVRNQGTAEAYANVAEISQGSKAAGWARLLEGEAHLTSGTELLFSDKEAALGDLREAQTAFETVLKAEEASADLKVRGLFGLARTLEATADGDLKPVLDRYEQIAAEYPDTVFGRRAEKRMAALKTPEAKAFYAWFSKQKPAPKDSIDRPSDAGRPTGAAAPSGSGTTPSAEGPSLGGATGTNTQRAAGGAAGSTPAGAAQEGTAAPGGVPGGAASPEASGQTPAARSADASGSESGGTVEESGASEPTTPSVVEPPATEGAEETPDDAGSAEPAASGEPQ